MANLLATYGIARESRVALLLLDTVDFPVAFWGAIKAGVVPVCLNTLLTTEQYAYILGDSRAKALFVSAPLLPVVQPILGQLPFLKHIFVAGGEPPPFALSVPRRAAASRRPEFQAADTCCDETAFWLYSSGSTGMPKGVRHVHSSPMETARLTGQGCLGMREDDLVFSAAKLFFAYGLGNAMSFPMSVGATAVLLPERPTPEVVFRTLKQYQPTLFFGVPTLYAAHAGLSAGHARERLAAPAPVRLGRRGAARRGRQGLQGQVRRRRARRRRLHRDAAPVRLQQPRRAEIRHLRQAGAGLRGAPRRRAGQRRRPTARSARCWCKGPSAAEGYWNQREKSRATFEGGWTRSGDKYTRDAEGYYTYQGRTDDMFKVSGIWVSPFEVESALIGHDAVLEAAVVPKEDGDGLLKPKAFIVLKPGKAAGQRPRARSSRSTSRPRPACGNTPAGSTFVDGLPKTATGKIQRFKLREG